MRVSTLTSVVLATAVASAVARSTYLKSSDGDWIGFVQVEGPGNGVTMSFFDHFDQVYVSPVSIDDTKLNLGDAYFRIYLPAYGPKNLTGFAIDYEHPEDAPPNAKGFSWAQNGTLEFSNPDFHGWVHCQGGKFDGSDGGRANYTSFYLATQPITSLPKNCTQVDLVKYEA